MELLKEYKLKTWGDSSIEPVDMQVGAEILSVVSVGKDIIIAAIVGPCEDLEVRKFYWARGGWEITDQSCYVGSVVDSGGFRQYLFEDMRA